VILGTLGDAAFALVDQPPYLSAQTAFYSLNPDRDIPGPLAISGFTDGWR
jgi:hypothetical protein